MDSHGPKELDISRIERLTDAVMRTIYIEEQNRVTEEPQVRHKIPVIVTVLLKILNYYLSSGKFTERFEIKPDTFKISRTFYKQKRG